MKNRLGALCFSSALAVCTLGGGPSTASTETVLYSFPSNASPIGRPDQDKKGALYGPTELLDQHGTIYRLKQKNGVWGEKTLYEFSGYGDGSEPYAGPLVDRATGILYGTTPGGGRYDWGAVYSLAPVGHGWSETVLHDFSYELDGAMPMGVLLKDQRTGNLYGTTSDGGDHTCGTAFELSQSNGSWTFGTIYAFQGQSDACGPSTQLKPGGKAGTLVGASPYAGAAVDGQVFRLKQTNGVWSNSILYTFSGGSDGGYPWDLDTASDGTVYGVAQIGGQHGYGDVFELIPNGKKYTFSVIYNFTGGDDGAGPMGINLDPATGNLYGTTTQGGTANGGTVFKLAANGGTWTETVLHSFTGGADDGKWPESRPTVDRTTGALYGTTLVGGTNNGGTLYEVQP